MKKQIKTFLDKLKLIRSVWRSKSHIIILKHETSVQIKNYNINPLDSALIMRSGLRCFKNSFNHEQAIKFFHRTFKSELNL